MIKSSRSITVSVWRDLVVTVCTVRDMKSVSNLGILISCFSTVSGLHCRSSVYAVYACA